MLEKIKLKKYLKIKKGTKNVRMLTFFVPIPFSIYLMF